MKEIITELLSRLATSVRTRWTEAKRDSETCFLHALLTLSVVVNISSSFSNELRAKRDNHSQTFCSKEMLCASHCCRRRVEEGEKVCTRCASHASSRIET